VPAGVNLSANKVSPQNTNTTITWTATGSNGTTPYSYKFFLSTDSGTSWSVVQNWSTSPTFAWTPSSPSVEYRVKVWIRSSTNSTEAYEDDTSVGFTIVPPSGSGGWEPAPIQTGTQAGTAVYYHTDAIGSVRMITDQSQAVLARHDFLPFGIEYNPPTDLTNPRLLFTGKERDVETGTTSAWQPLDYFGARYYQTQIGRFTTADPYNASASLTAPQTWNAYTYALNNPGKFVDPNGEHPGIIVGAVGGFVVGALTEAYAISKSGKAFDRAALLKIAGKGASGAIFGAAIGAAGPAGLQLGLGGTAIMGAAGSIVGGAVDRMLDPDAEAVDGWEILGDGVGGLAGGAAGYGTEKLLRSRIVAPLYIREMPANARRLQKIGSSGKNPRPARNNNRLSRAATIGNQYKRHLALWDFFAIQFPADQGRDRTKDKLKATVTTYEEFQLMQGARP
jgi:RHS repeat-associated protein